MLRLGLLLAEKYRVDGALGEGGMGVVYAATDVRLGRPVAVKVIHRARAQRREAKARFAREARVMASLSSRHAVALYDVGELEDGAPYLVQELVAGESLAERQRREPLSDGEACAAVADACAALAEAHAAGVVHRDVKPENLLLTVDNDGGTIVKVADFGLALEDDDERLTRTGALVGTARYMAPEQVEAARATDRTDVWALGVVLYELLARRAPFEGATPADLLANIATVEAIPMRTHRPDLPPPLGEAVDACLRRAAEARPSAAELRERLLPFAAAPRAVARPAAPLAPLPPELVRDRPGLPLAGAPPSPRPRAGGARLAIALAALGAIGVIGAVLGLLAFVTAPPRRPRPAASSPTAELAATSAPSAEAPPTSTASALAPDAAPASASASLCDCRGSGGARLCLTPQTPRCHCSNGGRWLWDTEAAARAHDGSYQSTSAARTRAGAEGAPCMGWVSVRGVPTNEAGVLECSVCEEPTRAAAAHGASCRGYQANGMLLDGRWECDSPKPPPPTADRAAVPDKLCECRDAGRLCSVRDEPVCQCNCSDCATEYPLHVSPERARAHPGDYAGYARDHRVQGFAIEGKCVGYYKPESGADVEKHPGKLSCSVCRHQELRVAAHGSRCHGFKDDGFETDGRWYCDVPAAERVLANKCRSTGPGQWSCSLH